MLYLFLLGITAVMGNVRADMPTPPARRIVFIGDSIRWAGVRPEQVPLARQVTQEPMSTRGA